MYSKVVQRFILLFSILLAAFQPGGPLEAQERDGFGQEPYSFVGMRLAELVSRFGSPRAVYASRGDEPWKDDVVFEYSEGDFYVFKDRVWQVSVKTAYNIKIGDSKFATLRALGDNVQDMGSYVLFSLSGGSLPQGSLPPSLQWPLAIRINFNAEAVSAIFIYRTDY